MRIKRLRNLGNGLNQNGRILAIIFLSVMMFMSFSMIDRGLWRPDEPRVAGICAEMARTGDYVMPRLNGRPFLEYPPMYYVAGAVMGRIIGTESDVPYRLVSLLFGLVTLGVVFLLMYHSSGMEGGVLAAGILASSWGFFRVWHWIIVDIALVGGVTVAMYAYIRLTRTDRVRYAVLLGLGIGMSFLAKGLVGPAIIAAALLADMIRQRGFTPLWGLQTLLIVACALLPIIPWFVTLYQRGGWPFLREVVVVNSVMRFTGAPEGAALGHQQGPLFYWDGMLRHMLPWSLLLVPAVVMSLRRYREDPFLGWIIGPLVLLSLAATKRGQYLVPLFPAAACLIATWLMSAPRQKWETWMLGITWGMAVLGSLAPFAGIGLGHPVLGLGMGCIAFVALLSFVACKRAGVMHRQISLVLIVCVAVSACTTVYFAYQKPLEDNLAFARKVVHIANGRDITLIGHDESTRGLFSMVAGRTLPVIAHPDDLAKPGLYVWSDRDSRILRELQAVTTVELYWHAIADNTEISMAYIKPDVE